MKSEKAGQNSKNDENKGTCQQSRPSILASNLLSAVNSHVSFNVSYVSHPQMTADSGRDRDV